MDQLKWIIQIPKLWKLQEWRPVSQKSSNTEDKINGNGLIKSLINLFMIWSMLLILFMKMIFLIMIFDLKTYFIVKLIKLMFSVNLHWQQNKSKRVQWVVTELLQTSFRQKHIKVHNMSLSQLMFTLLESLWSLLCIFLIPLTIKILE